MVDEIGDEIESISTGEFHNDSDLPIPLYFGISLVLGGVGLLVYQVYLYLQDGAWASFSCLKMMLLIDPNSLWLSNPNNWVGLHTVMQNIPFSGFLVVLGVIVIWVGDSFES